MYIDQLKGPLNILGGVVGKDELFNQVNHDVIAHAFFQKGGTSEVHVVSYALLGIKDEDLCGVGGSADDHFLLIRNPVKARGLQPHEYHHEFYHFTAGGQA